MSKEALWSSFLKELVWRRKLGYISATKYFGFMLCTLSVFLTESLSWSKILFEHFQTRRNKEK